MISELYAHFEYSVSSVFGDRVTPDPIPNSVVKSISADGTSSEGE